jgi:membrane-bound lytic murein transglycosylase D
MGLDLVGRIGDHAQMDGAIVRLHDLDEAKRLLKRIRDMKNNTIRHLGVSVLVFGVFGCSTSHILYPNTIENEVHPPVQMPHYSDKDQNISSESVESSLNNFSHETSYNTGSNTFDEISDNNVKDNNVRLNTKNEEDNSSDVSLSHQEEQVKMVHQSGEEPISDKEIVFNKSQEFLDTALEFYEASQNSWSKGNSEDAIESLDQAYRSILEVNPDHDSSLTQQIEDLRLMISKRILEIYASRYTAVNGNHDAIPLIMNKHVEREIKLFQGPERRSFVSSYRRAGRYRQQIVAALQEAGLPEELSWLPLIESGFKVRALSRARALGLWQFIPSTGYKFGLQRNTWIDERLDPEKSTAAAIAYLQELHQIFGDWTTVLAAYNCGEGMVLKVIREQKINYLDNFWDLYQKLPRETARYVPRFLAALHILKDPEKYGFNLQESSEVFSYESITIDKQVHLKEVAKQLKVTLEELGDLNPELRYQITPSSPYPLNVPHGKGKLLLTRMHNIPSWSPPQRSYTYHIVRKGETLSIIAFKYKTSVRYIMRANNIHKKNFIKVGRKLRIPIKGIYRKTTYLSSVGMSSNGNYRVKKGDSLWLIARRFNTTTELLKSLNNLESARLSVGQLLKINNN